MRFWEFIAVLTSMLFSGAAIYINLVEHPARMECGTELAATVFGPSYRRVAVMQAALALAATVAGTCVWLLSQEVVWLGSKTRSPARTPDSCRRPRLAEPHLRPVAYPEYNVSWRVIDWSAGHRSALFIIGSDTVTNLHRCYVWLQCEFTNTFPPSGPSPILRNDTSKLPILMP